MLLFFKLLVQALEIDYLGLSWYSLRRGGATANFMLHGNMELTLQFGRWSSTRTSKRYVMQAVAEVVKMSLNNRQRALLREAAGNVHKFLREVTGFPGLLSHIYILLVLPYLS